MTPLKTTQQVFTWLCIYPAENSFGKRQHLIFMMLSASVFVTLSSFVLASMAFIWKFIAIDFDVSLDALYPILGWIPLINAFLATILLKHQIVAIFDALTRIYDERIEKEDGSIPFLTKVDEKCEAAWTFYFKYGLIGFGVSQISTLLVSLLWIYFTHQPFNRDDLYLQYKLLLPWNQSTPYGYLTETCYTIFASEVFLSFHGAVFLLFISLCWHYHAFGEIFQYLVKKLKRGSSKVTNNNRKILCDAISLQCSVRSLFFTSAHLFKAIITGYILLMIAIACAIYEMDLKMQHPDCELVMLLISVTSGIANLFVQCYFGKLTTESFVNMADSVYALNWHTFDMDLKKSLIPIIQLGQRPLTYEGYGILTLNLETFTQLIKTIFSYYMFLKTF